jgi:hypothetical protein
MKYPSSIFDDVNHAGSLIDCRTHQVDLGFAGKGECDQENKGKYRPGHNYLFLVSIETSKK